MFVEEAKGADKTVAKFVTEVVEDLFNSGWTASNPTDSGSWGKAVHDAVAAKINGQWWGRSERWLTKVLVKNDGSFVQANFTGIVPQGYTEIDVLYLADGYKPTKNQVLDQSKIAIYEIKTSANGAIPDNGPDSQLQRLKNIQGADIRRIQTEYKWKQSTNTLVVNKSYNRQLTSLRKLGKGVALVGAVVAFTQADEAFAEFEQELQDLAEENDPVQAAIQRTVVFDKFKNYVNAATGGVAEGAMNAVFVGYVYGVLLPELADPQSDWNQGE